MPDFTQSLARVPVLLPTSHTAVRGRLDLWLSREGIRPALVGEFEDSALLKTFGASGLGAFPAPAIVEEELTGRYGVLRVRRCRALLCNHQLKEDPAPAVVAPADAKGLMRNKHPATRAVPEAAPDSDRAGEPGLQGAESGGQQRVGRVLVRLAGIEPTTLGFGGQYSIH